MKPVPRLDLAEELILLALDDETGRLIRGGTAVAALDRAVAAALLMQLALAHRIDTDSTHVFVISPEPIGTALADEIPTAHDALLIGLVDAAGLFHEVIDHATLSTSRPRISRIANLEELSRSLRHTIQGLQRGVIAANP